VRILYPRLSSIPLRGMIAQNFPRFARARKDESAPFDSSLPQNKVGATTGGSPDRRTNRGNSLGREVQVPSWATRRLDQIENNGLPASTRTSHGAGPLVSGLPNQIDNAGLGAVGDILDLLKTPLWLENRGQATCESLEPSLHVTRWQLRNGRISPRPACFAKALQGSPHSQFCQYELTRSNCCHRKALFGSMRYGWSLARSSFTAVEAQRPFIETTAGAPTATPRIYPALSSAAYRSGSARSRSSVRSISGV
jgi:hypothetical protein